MWRGWRTFLALATSLLLADLASAREARLWSTGPKELEPNAGRRHLSASSADYAFENRSVEYQSYYARPIRFTDIQPLRGDKVCGSLGPKTEPEVFGTVDDKTDFAIYVDSGLAGLGLPFPSYAVQLWMTVGGPGSKKGNLTQPTQPVFIAGIKESEDGTSGSLISTVVEPTYARIETFPASLDPSAAPVTCASIVWGFCDEPIDVVRFWLDPAKKSGKRRITNVTVFTIDFDAEVCIAANGTRIRKRKEGSTEGLFPDFSLPPTDYYYGPPSSLFAAPPTYKKKPASGVPIVIGVSVAIVLTAVACLISGPRKVFLMCVNKCVRSAVRETFD